MRSVIFALTTLGLLVSGLCGDTNDADLPPSLNHVVTYYDRNGDGKVDVELHHLPGAADADWALIDTKFRGRYDVRVAWGYTFVKEAINLPVPVKVKVTPGKPPPLAEID